MVWIRASSLIIVQYSNIIFALVWWKVLVVFGFFKIFLYRFQNYFINLPDLIKKPKYLYHMWFNPFFRLLSINSDFFMKFYKNITINEQYMLCIWSNWFLNSVIILSILIFSFYKICIYCIVWLDFSSASVKEGNKFILS
mgnify:CR=1 FL=1|jgi:hypothetical protein